ncbi:MAG: diguanylate cyclase [Alphaproteobacteria bacterium]|nr:diguanylate cyclase [Alphaproteobacteria bacterium]
MTSETIISPRAQIACVAGDEAAFEALTTAFHQAGFAIARPDAGMSADVGLIDLRRQAVSPRKAKTIAGALRRKSPESPLVFVVDPTLDAAVRTALRRFGEVIPAQDQLGHIVVRCREIIRLRNIAEETGERLKSLATLNRLVEFPVITTTSTQTRILIAGAPGPAAMAAVSAVSAIAGDATCVLNASQAMRALEHDDFDCAIFLPTAENDPMLAFVRTLRRHPKHAHLAIIQIADHPADLATYARKGARDFVLAEQIAVELAAKTQLASRRARLLRSMRKFLNSCKGEGIRDASSGAFTSLFLTEHANRICARADQTGRAMSLTIASLSDADGQASTARTLNHAARLINRVTRAEDLVARISRKKFIILSPATSVEDAKKIGLRISGVLANTAFRNQRTDKPYAIDVITKSYARPRGLCIEECVAAGLKDIDGVSIPPRRRSPR